MLRNKLSLTRSWWIIFLGCSMCWSALFQNYFFPMSVSACSSLSWQMLVVSAEESHSPAFVLGKEPTYVYRNAGTSSELRR